MPMSVAPSFVEVDRLDLILEFLPDRDAGVDRPGLILPVVASVPRTERGQDCAAVGVRLCPRRGQLALVAERELLRGRARDERDVRAPLEARILRDLAARACAGCRRGGAGRLRARAPRSHRSSSPRKARCSTGRASPAAGSITCGRSSGGRKPRHSALAGARERQALVPRLRLELMQAGVPVADVPVRVDRHHVLVPGHGVHGLVDVSDVLGPVQLVDADDRLELPVPDRVAARQRDSFAGVLDRSVDGAADPLGGRPGRRRVALAAAFDQVGERAGQVGRGRLPGEDLVAAVHRALLALEAVGLGAGHLLDVEVVLVGEART